MAFNTERVAATYAKEILKYPKGFEAVRNAVVDGTQVAANGDGRYIVESGQVMVYISGAGSKVKPAPSSGVSAADIAGILQHTTEFYRDPAIGAEANKTDQPVSLFFDDCIFDTSKLLSYSSNATAVKAALPTCTFE